MGFMVRENAFDSISPGSPLPPGINLPGGAGCSATTLVQVSAAPGQTVLTVGAGGEFKTIGAAVAAAANGDLILIQPGIYTNDFADITAQVTIAGAGGLVELDATTAPPNEKGIFVVDANVTIDNLVFQGAAIPDEDGGNGAGIRYQGGVMVLNNDAFIGNQDGILAAAVDSLPVNTITITDSTFDSNGNSTGPNAGYTHNCYISTGVTSLTATGNIFEQANVGHELKSRALTNVITGNVFYDGPTGTASYDIDLPNGGADTVSGNIIEKGPDAQNDALIHFGGEGIPYAGSALSVTGNRLINDLGSGAVGVLNQTTLQVSITGNEFDNFANAALAEGPYVQSGNWDQTGTPIAPTDSNLFAPGTDVDDFSQDNMPHTVDLTTSTGVLGGGGLLTVTAEAGHVTVVGGSGGLRYTEAAGFGGSLIATAAGASDSITAPGQDAILSAGQDSITGGTGNLSVQVDGSASIAGGSGSNAYAVNGAASIAGAGGSDTVQVNAPGALAAITGAEAYLQLTVSGGTGGFDIMQGGVRAQATITGGASSTRVYGGDMNVTTAGAGAGARIVFGAGTATLVSNGADTIQAGSGVDTVIVTGSSLITGGTGALSVFGRSEAGTATVLGAHGSISISGDSGGIVYDGGAASNTVTAALSTIALYGGSGLMDVIAGSNQSVSGGSGGMVFATQGGNDAISTQAGARDTIAFAGACTLVSNGTDMIAAGSGNSTITANGHATITGSTGNAFYTLNGADSLTANGYTRATVGAGAYDTISALGSLTCITLSSGGTLSFVQKGNADHEAATVTGAGAFLMSSASANTTNVTLGGAGDGVVLGQGHDSVAVAGAGAHLWAGPGSDTVTIAVGGAVLHGGAGALTVNLNDWQDQTATTIAGGGGALTQAAGSGNLSFTGGRGTAYLGGTTGSETVTAGAGNITLQGGNAGTVFTAGTGHDSVTLTGSGATVTFGSGTSNIAEANWGQADIFDFTAGHGGGSDSISGFRTNTDHLVFKGVTITANVSQGGSTQLTLSDGTHVTLLGVAAYSPH
jgi:hypothetical protein